MPTTLELLERQINQIKDLESLPSSQAPEFKQWEQTTKAIIEKKLGRVKSDNFPSSFNFFPNHMGPWEDFELKDSLKDGLAIAKAYLNSLKEEIELLGEEPSFLNSKTFPSLKFGESSKNGQSGGGGSVFLYGQSITISDSAKISADGGDIIKIQNVDLFNKETLKLLEDLRDSLNKKDSKTALKILGFIADKSFDLFVAILAGRVLKG